ncbi:MAG TPA: SLATT domain-containing protein [Polyangiaceae bacterium]|nr:SLATT domain-containing protein [Polyangiaceae bacterium]
MINKTRELLEKWNGKAKGYRDLHYAASVRLRRMHYIIGIPTIALTALVGTAVFATLEKTVELWVRIALGFVSVMAATLAALQTFLRFSERAEIHRQASVGYDAVTREIEQTLAEELPDAEVKPAIERIRKRLDELGQAPELSEQDQLTARRVPSASGARVSGLEGSRRLPSHGSDLSSSSPERGDQG